MSSRQPERGYPTPHCIPHVLPDPARDRSSRTPKAPCSLWAEARTRRNVRIERRMQKYSGFCCDECETLSTIRMWSYPYNMRSGINQDLGCVIGRCTISQRFASVLPIEHAIPQKDRDLYSFKPRWVFATWFASYRASISVAVLLISCTAPIVHRLRPLPSWRIVSMVFKFSLRARTA